MNEPEALPPVALYVHIPFCISLCPYCDFVVYAGAAARGDRSRVDALIDGLHAEIDLRADAVALRFGAWSPLETVYFGGGTPSLVGPERIGHLLNRIANRFGIAPRTEITIEANPGPEERGDLASFRRAGVTRLSFGAQSMDNDELRRIGRRHRATDVVASVGEARAAGFESVSLDLLYDIPDGSLATWASSLEQALVLEPDHLSLYALTLDDPDAEGLTGSGGDHLPTTAGARRWRDRARPRQDEDRAAAQYRLAAERLASAGWRGYEISNWARPGHESRHNLAYWQRRPYEAVGPGAHAFDGARRRWNAASLDGYNAALVPSDGGRRSMPPGGSESIDAETAETEAVILGLRTDAGVSRGVTTRSRFRSAFAWAQEHGLVTERAPRSVVLTTRGRLLSNELFARLV